MNYVEIANKIVASLEKKGIVSYVWHVSKYDSVYIRFENNNLGSIRVGDHDGRSRLKYRFNVRADIKKAYNEQEGNNWRYYVPVDQWELIVIEIFNRYKVVKDWISKRNYTIPNIYRFRESNKDRKLKSDKIVIENMNYFKTIFPENCMEYDNVIRGIRETPVIPKKTNCISVNYDSEGSCQFEIKCIKNNVAILNFIGTAR